MTIDKFDKVLLLGKGSYSKVYLIKQKVTGEMYALKITHELSLEKDEKEKQPRIENDILTITNHPNIIKLFHSFRENGKIYFSLEYAPNGDLNTFLEWFKRHSRNVPYPIAQHYIAEIVNALEYLHSKKIVHRDLKPDNILLDENFHLKVSDFGTAKILNDQSEKYYAKRSTFVGTANYISPEVLQGKNTTTASDLWALGCILYQFFAGHTPFIGKTEYLICEAILKADYKFPLDIPPAVMSLCQKLIVFEPDKRLGSGLKGSGLGYDALKSDPFFAGVDFDNLPNIALPIPKNMLDPPQKNDNKLVNVDSEVMDLTKKIVIKPTIESEFVIVDVSKDLPRRNSVIVIKRSVLKMESSFFLYSGYKQKMLILNTKPQLFYCDAKSGDYESEIQLTKQTLAQIIAQKKFRIITPKKTYNFKGSSQQDIKHWVREINNMIQRHYHLLQ